MTLRDDFDRDIEDRWGLEFKDFSNHELNDLAAEIQEFLGDFEEDSLP